MDPIRVLVVDDEPAMATVTRIYLEERNRCTCEVCTSAQEALRYLESATVDIIVSDYQMPGMDGIEFLKAVRAGSTYIPFILFTGRSREEVVIEALNSGADFYLQKGADPEAQFAELSHMIRRAVEDTRSKEALLEAESLTRIILDNVTENVIFQDGACRIIWANRAARYTAGNLGDDITGRHCYEIWHKRSQPCENCPVLEAIATGEPHAALTRVPGGGEWILRGTPVRDAKGTIIGAVKTGLEVTALKAIEAERVRTMEQLDLAIEAANLAVWDWYPAEQKMLYSDAYAKMLGYAPEELELHDGTFAHMVHPEDLPATKRAIREHFAGKTPYVKTEFRMRCRDGTWKWIHGCGRVFERDDDGTPLRMVGMHQDITGRKTTEQTLRESEQRLKTAIEGAGICVWEKDFTTGSVTNTGNFAGIFGYTPGKLNALGKDEQARIHPEDLASVQSAYESGFSGIQGFADATFRLKGGDGTWRWFSSRGRTVEWDAEGAPARRLGILQNIDHIVQAEEQRHESDQALRTLLDALVEPALLIDKDCRVRVANRSVIGRIGISPEDISGLSIFDLIHPENALIRKKHIDAVIKTGKPAYFDDERAGRFLQHHIYPVVGRDGSIESVAAIAYDITETRQQESRLKESEERLTLALEATGEGFVDWNIPADEMYWSPRMFSMLGYEPDEFPPSLDTWRPLVHPDDLGGVEDSTNRLFAGTTDTCTNEYRLRTSSGEWLWVLSTIKAIERDAGGTPIRVVGTHKDITEHKRLEAQIIAGRDLAFGLAAASSLEEAFSLCVRYAMDVSGLDCGGLFIFNEASGALTLTHTVGLSDSFVRKETEKQRSAERIRQVLEGGVQYPGFSDLDDSLRQLLEEEGIRAWAILPLLFEGRAIGCINIASRTRDEIPESCRSALEAMSAEIGSAIARIQTREALKESNFALKSANHALNLLSSITRHDILNQVSAMKAYLILLEEETLESPRSSELCGRMKEITDTVRRQITFTGDYQQMGEKSPEWQHVEWTMKRAAESALVNGIHLDVATGPLEIFADPILEKAFFNLLENAVSHGRHVSGIRVAFHDEEGHGFLVLEDDGAGVPADMKQHIFEKGVGTNTGYGLFLVREILEITGMTIRERGEEGRGARFEIHIPEGKWRADNPSA
jgi:PAS domain S-box-containing protein